MQPFLNANTPLPAVTFLVGGITICAFPARLSVSVVHAKCAVACCEHDVAWRCKHALLYTGGHATTHSTELVEASLPP